MSEYLDVVVDELHRVVRVVRTPRPYPDADAAVLSFREARRACEPVDRARYGLLLDVRLAPGRNDPDFEAAMVQPRRELFGAFERRAVLVKTTIGRMQVARISHEQAKEDVQIFLDETEALEHLARR